MLEIKGKINTKILSENSGFHPDQETRIPETISEPEKKLASLMSQIFLPLFFWDWKNKCDQ